MSEVQTPAVDGGVLSAGQTPESAPQAVPGSPAPVEQVQVQAPNPLEVKLAQMESQMQAMYHMMGSLQQPQIPAAPQAPAAAQPTLAERIAALGDPVTATDPAAWNAGLAKAMEEEIQSRMGKLEQTLNPRLQTLQQIEQERAFAAQTAEISRALKSKNPDLAQVPDALIGQRLSQLQNPDAFLQFFANDIRGLMTNTPQQPSRIPAPVQPQPSDAAVLPQGSPNANLVQMQADYRKWATNGTAAQEARMSDPVYFSQVHAAAVANKWGR